MAPEKRLIDANEAIKKAKESDKIVRSSIWETGEVVEFLEDCPTVDAVEVPCKIGETAWIIRASNSRLIVKQGVVTEIHIRLGRNPFIVMANVGRGEWGAKVFATEKGAYAAIGERNK